MFEQWVLEFVLPIIGIGIAYWIGLIVGNVIRRNKEENDRGRK